MADELTDGQIELVDNYIAYEGIVEVKKWMDMSAHGFKVTLAIGHRHELDAFDGVMYRRKGKAGHIYQIVLYKADTGEIAREMECQFWGRNWSETGGASIALHFGGDDQRWWMLETKTADQGEAEDSGNRFRIMMMEKDIDTGHLVHQGMARAVEAADKEARGQEAIANQPEPLKGGKHSKHVARFMQDLDFNEWLNNESIYKSEGPFHTTADIDALVKDKIGMRSKVELDHIDGRMDAWMNQFERPFLKSMRAA